MQDLAEKDSYPNLIPKTMFRKPTAAVNLFHVGKQYLSFCKAKATVTRNLIGRNIISNVKRSDTRNPLPTEAFVTED